MGSLMRMQVGRLQVTAVSGVVTRARANFRHHHDFYEMLYVLEGSTHIRIRRRRHVAGVGDLVIFHPWEDHLETVQAGRWSFIVLRFPEPRLGREVSFPPRRATPPVVGLPWRERFQKLFELMMLDLKARDSWTEVMSKAYLVQFAVLLRRALRAVRGGRPREGDDRTVRVEGAIDLIRESLTADLSLRELARRAFMSESGFSHLFKDMTGIPPRRYAIQVRMARARELLETSRLSVKEIAAELGYADQHYFSRAFRKVAGRPPSAFRGRSRKVHRTGRRVHLPAPPA